MNVYDFRECIMIFEFVDRQKERLTSFKTGRNFRGHVSVFALLLEDQNINLFNILQKIC